MSTRCAWCGEAIELDEAGSWIGPWLPFDDDDIADVVEGRLYCLKSPDHKHHPGKDSLCRCQT